MIKRPGREVHTQKPLWQWNQVHERDVLEALILYRNRVFAGLLTAAGRHLVRGKIGPFSCGCC